MKKLLLVCMCVLAFAACKQEKAKGHDPAMAQQRDSLNQIIAQKENELNDMMGTMNEIEEGFREINEAQNRVNLAKGGEEATVPSASRRTSSSSNPPCGRTGN